MEVSHLRLTLPPFGRKEGEGGVSDSKRMDLVRGDTVARVGYWSSGSYKMKRDKGQLMFRILTDTLVWVGIVTLALIAILAKGELNELQGKSKAQEKVIKGLELQLRGAGFDDGKE